MHAVIGDEYVDPEFGTGVLKITPAHDINDYEIGKRHGLKSITILNKDGTMNSNAGRYQGMDRFECRNKLWEDINEEGNSLGIEEIENRVPRSQRGGDVIEPIVSTQWFVKTKVSASFASRDAVYLSSFVLNRA